MLEFDGLPWSKCIDVPILRRMITFSTGHQELAVEMRCYMLNHNDDQSMT